MFLSSSDNRLLGSPLLLDFWHSKFLKFDAFGKSFFYRNLWFLYICLDVESQNNHFSFLGKLTTFWMRTRKFIQLTNFFLYAPCFWDIMVRCCVTHEQTMFITDWLKFIIFGCSMVVRFTWRMIILSCCFCRICNLFSQFFLARF